MTLRFRAHSQKSFKKVWLFQHFRVQILKHGILERIEVSQHFLKILIPFSIWLDIAR